MTDLFAALDQKIEKDILIIKKHPARNIELEYKDLYLKALYLLAASDSFIDREEVKYIEIVAKSIDFDTAKLAGIKQFAEKIDVEAMEAFLRSFSKISEKDFPVTAFYLDLYLLAWRDEERTSNEVLFINRLDSYMPVGSYKNKVTSLAKYIFENHKVSITKATDDEEFSFLKNNNLSQIFRHLQPDSPENKQQRKSLVVDLTKKAEKALLLFAEHPIKEESHEVKTSYLYCLAAFLGIDGEIHDNEKKILELMVTSFDLTSDVYQNLLEFALAPEPEILFESLASFKDSVQGEILYLDCCLVCWFDQDRCDKETALLKRFESLLSLDVKVAEKLENLANSVRLNENLSDKTYSSRNQYFSYAKSEHHTVLNKALGCTSISVAQVKTYLEALSSYMKTELVNQ